MKADPNTRILEHLYKSFADNLEEDDSLEVKLLMPEESGLETPVLTTLHHSFGTTANLAEGAFFFEDDVFVARVLLAPPSSVRYLAVAGRAVEPVLVRWATKW